MRALLTEEYLKIREGVTITVKARKVTVKGPKGSITKDFSHMSVDIRIMKM
jgi:large subunit ribosomal protein L9e